MINPIMAVLSSFVRISLDIILARLGFYGIELNIKDEFMI